MNACCASTNQPVKEEQMSQVVSGAGRDGTSDSIPVDLSIDEPQIASLTRSVLSQVRGINRQDAEDAVQEAWIVLAEKAGQLEPGPTGGYLMRTARFKAMQIRDKRHASVSLDALAEVAGDGVAELADPHFASADMHAELAELASDPVAARVLEAAAKGASPRVAPRGMKHQCARYSDDQIARVRKLRRQSMTYYQIEELTGVPAGYCSCIVRRGARVTETTDGWTPQLVIDALQRFHQRRGSAPRFRDADGDPTMPSANTARRYFGTWREAVRAAGLDPVYGERRVQPWTQEEMVRAFCAWRLHKKHWPNVADMRTDPDLPSPATTRRHFGTQSPRRLADAVLALLA
jgi:DNA-directed RNA polymerase specialized sigma24 family protein